MIRTKEDLRRYIKADYEAQGIQNPLKERLKRGDNWVMFSYLRTLHKFEYYKNAPPTILRRILKVYFYLKHQHNCWKYNIYIASNVVGEGLKIMHPGFRRVGKIVKHMGKNCTILPMVLFGKKTPGLESRCIEIGDNCYFGTGCTILGPVKIGNNVTVGAGAVVTKDVPDNCTVAGVPAKVIASKI